MSHRAANHKSSLKRGAHYNERLQKSYDLYGPENFIVEFYPTDKRLIDAENERIALRRSQGVCCNYQGTEEWKSKLSERVKKQHAEKNFGAHTWSEEGRRAVRYASTVRENVMKGQCYGPEHGLKIAAKLKGKKKSAAHIAAATAARWNGKRRKDILK